MPAVCVPRQHTAPATTSYPPRKCQIDSRIEPMKSRKSHHALAK